MKTHITRETVRYNETDRMKVAHHAGYLIWFELGRTGLMNSAGFSYKNMEDNGVFLPVIEYTCRISNSVGYNDRIEIETWIEELKNRMVAFGYEARINSILAATGRTRHVCINSENKIIKLPENIMDLLKTFQQDE